MFSGVAWTITKWTDEALEAIGLTLDGLLEPEEPNAHGTVFSDGLVCACAQDGSGRGRMAARRCGVCGARGAAACGRGVTRRHCLILFTT
jgi:hypothetical protein